MNTIQIVIIAVSVVLLAIILYFFVLKKPKMSEIITDDFIQFFDLNNITNIEYIRNKIVLSYKNIKEFDAQKLQELGGKSITIVGDKVKFLMSDDNIINERYFNTLLEQFERL